VAKDATTLYACFASDSCQHAFIWQRDIGRRSKDSLGSVETLSFSWCSISGGCQRSRYRRWVPFVTTVQMPFFLDVQYRAVRGQ